MLRNIAAAAVAAVGLTFNYFSPASAQSSYSQGEWRFDETQDSYTDKKGYSASTTFAFLGESAILSLGCYSGKASLSIATTSPGFSSSTFRYRFVDQPGKTVTGKAARAGIILAHEKDAAEFIRQAMKSESVLIEYPLVVSKDVRFNLVGFHENAGPLLEACKLKKH